MANVPPVAVADLPLKAATDKLAPPGPVLVGAAMLLFLGLLLLYWPALRGGFVWDDDANITLLELRSWHGLERIWLQLGATQTYYPALHTLYWIEHKLWGDETLGYHVAGILFHSISVCLVYLIVRRLRIPGALLAAAIFAVHPVYVESIAWITEQKNTFSGMFYLASALAYLHFDERRRPGNYALALGLFVLALVSKATAVTLPIALLVIVWWKYGSLSPKRDLLPLVPWFALGALVGMFTVWFEKVYVGVQGAQFALTPVQKCLLASRAVWFYLAKLFWPSNLTFIYPRWELDAADPWQYLYPAALIALFAAAWLAHWRWRAPLAALLFFVGTLFPLLGFFPTFIFSYTYVCDHFQYLPSLGMVVLVAAGITLALNRLPLAARGVGQAFCIAGLSTLAVLTWQQAHMYSDIISLYQTTIDRNPSCWMAYNNLGNVLATSGRVPEAIECYNQALTIKPDFAFAQNDLAGALVLSNRLPEAIDHYQLSLDLDPNNANTRKNFGIALSRVGRRQEAVEQFQYVVRLQPNSSAGHYNLGLALVDAGRFQEAGAQYQQALQLDPDNSSAHNNLANLLRAAGANEEAIEHFEDALRLEPGSPIIHMNLSAALMNVGRTGDAIAHFQKAVELNVDSVAAHFNLAKAYTQLNRVHEAIAEAEKALQLARSHAQPAQAEQIQSWLSTQTAGESKATDEPPVSNIAPTQPK